MKDLKAPDGLLKQYAKLTPMTNKLDGFERQVWQRINVLEAHKNKSWLDEIMGMFSPALPRVAFAALAIAVGMFSAQITSGEAYRTASSSMQALSLDVFSIRYAAPLYAPLQSEEG